MKAPSPLARPFTAAPRQETPPLKAAANYLLVCVAVIAVFWVSLGMAGITLNFDFVGQYRDRIGSGFLLTVELSAASLVGCPWPWVRARACCPCATCATCT